MSSDFTFSMTSISCVLVPLALPVVAELQDVRRQRAQHAKTNAKALLSQPAYERDGIARPRDKDRLLTAKKAKRFFAAGDWIFDCAFPASNAICYAYKPP